MTANQSDDNSENRIREHPAKRFAASNHMFDLREAVREIEAEDAVSSHGHRQKTLYRHGKATVAIFRFNQNAGLTSHKAAGTVTIHVLDGQMRIVADSTEHHLTAGQIVILAPGVEHSVHAVTKATMLLQVHLE